MKIAVLSDIHSNLPALQAAQEVLNKAGVGKVLCAGDVVGYGASPNECCEIVRGLASHCVLGNHEESVLTRDTSRMTVYAARASEWTSGVLDRESRDYLITFKDQAKIESEGSRIVMCHGSIQDIWQYVEEHEAQESMLSKSGADILIMGHTHRPYVRRFSSGMILNPGSVGQPRDGDPRGSLAVVDSRERDYRIVRFEYDIEAARAAIISAGLPDFLWERLFFGT